MIAALAGIVVVFAGVGAYLQAYSVGPGTTAFVVRLLLVSIAVAGALLLGLGLRMRNGGTKLVDSAAQARMDREP